jgi:hypothetical protein
MALSNSAMVLYTTDNYTVIRATVDPNYNSGTIKNINVNLLVIVIMFTIIVNYY